MGEKDINVHLTKHIDEAYAMEQNVLRMRDSMIGAIDDPQIRRELEHHKQETEQQAERLKSRLDAHGSSPSMVREAGGTLGALMKGVVDLVRGYEEAGCDELVLLPTARGLDQLDRLAEVLG